jgi:uncharacterized membrane protein
MQKITPNLIKVPKWLKFVIIIILTLGIFFRFVNLDKKIYWGDEVYTSLRLSGYLIEEVNKDLFKGRIVSQEDIQKYQLINSDKGLVDTVKGLALEEPQLPPLYFTITRFWVQTFGNSIAVTRSLSALISLFIFPLIYWLSLELFNSSLVGWIAMAIVAVSPFDVVYAQEARPYCLWTITILLSSTLFLRSLRLKNNLSWVLYTIANILGLYTDLLHILVIFGHGLYVLVIESGKIRKTFIAYCISTSSALLAFTPWIVFIFLNFSSLEKTSKWGLVKIPLSNLVQEWLRNISYSFMDFWHFFTYYPDSKFNLAYGTYGTYLTPLLLILIGYSFYFICRKAPLHIWSFIMLLMVSNVLPLVLPDIIRGGYRSIMGRYFIPCYLGIHLSVAYLFANKIKSIWLWKFSFLLLLLGGILSCSVSSQADTWWNKRTPLGDIILASIINKTSNSLIIVGTGFDFGQAASLNSRIDHPDINYQFLIDNKVPIIPKNFNKVFLLEPTAFKINQVEKEQNLQSKLVYKGPKENLWQLEHR